MERTFDTRDLGKISAIVKFIVTDSTSILMLSSTAVEALTRHTSRLLSLIKNSQQVGKADDVLTTILGWRQGPRESCPFIAHSPQAFCCQIVILYLRAGLLKHIYDF